MTGDLDLRLVLRFVDRATAPFRAAAGGIKQGLRNSGADRVAIQVGEVARRVSVVTGLISGQARQLGRVALLLAGPVLTAVPYAFKRLFIDPAAEVEQLRLQLTGLLGDAAKARQALDGIFDIEGRSPFDTGALVDAFRELRQAGLDPTKGALKGVVDLAIRAGGQQGDLSRIVGALTGAMNAGRLTTAATGALGGDRAWELLSKRLRDVTGKILSPDQLRKLAERGELGRRSIRELLTVLVADAQGAADQWTRSWDGMGKAFRTMWTRFRRMVMDAGVFDWLKGKLQALLDWTQRAAADGRLKALAEQVSAWLIRFLDRAWQAGRTAIGILRQIKANLAETAMELGGWRNLAILVGAALEGPLIGGLLMAIASVVQLGVVLAATPVGWFVAAVAAIAVAAFLIYRHWTPIKAFFKALWADLLGSYQRFYQAFRNVLAELNPVPWIRDMIGKVERFLEQLDWSELGRRAVRSFLAGMGQVGRWAAGALMPLPMPAPAGGALQPGGFQFRPSPAPLFGPGGAAGRGRPVGGNIEVNFRNAPPGTRVRNDSDASVRVTPARGPSMLP